MFALFFFLLRADTSLFLFNLIFQNFTLHIFLIINIIIRCSMKFRDVPGCSRVLLVPGFFAKPNINR